MKNGEQDLGSTEDLTEESPMPPGVAPPWAQVPGIDPRLQPLAGGCASVTAGQMTPWITANMNVRVRDKWKSVPARLLREELIKGKPDNSGKTWSEFGALVEYRNGLLHAAASRPTTPGQPDEEAPTPRQAVLGQLQPGWAVGTVKDLIGGLNAAAGTNAPDCL